MKTLLQIILICFVISALIFFFTSGWVIVRDIPVVEWHAVEYFILGFDSFIGAAFLKAITDEKRL